jgi:CHASE2 domain-containing sensor protein
MKKLIFLFIIILALPLVFQSTPTEVLKLKIYDALVSKQDPSGYFTILNITEDDIDREGGYPIPRQRLGEIHREIMNRGALGVGWVISFPHPDRFGGDKYFADSLQQGTTILAMFEAPNQKYPKTIGTVIQGPDIGGMVSKGVVQNTNNLRKNVAQGISAAPPDIDNLVRRMPLLLRTPDGYVSSFGTEVLKTLVGAKTYIIKTNDNGIEQIAVRGLPPIKTDSLGRKWIR